MDRRTDMMELIFVFLLFFGSAQKTFLKTLCAGISFSIILLNTFAMHCTAQQASSSIAHRVIEKDGRVCPSRFT